MNDLKAERFTAEFREILQAETAIAAIWLTGSHGRGDHDDVSDLDMAAYVADGRALPEIFQRLADRLAQNENSVFVKTIPRNHVINTIDRDWNRVDIALVDTVNDIAHDTIQMVFDRADIAATIPHTRPATAQNPHELQNACDDFIRIAGMLPVVLAREDYVTAVTGAGLLRDRLIQLMVIRHHSPVKRGALSLRKMVAGDDYEILRALPPVEATRLSVMAAHRALAALFQPLAQDLYHAHGLVWPSAFAQAAWRQLDGV